MWSNAGRDPVAAVDGEAASAQRRFQTFPRRTLTLMPDGTFNRLRHKPAGHITRAFSALFWKHRVALRSLRLTIFSHLSRPRNLPKKAGSTPYSARYNPQWMTEMRRLTSKPRAIESLTGSTLNDRSNEQVNVIAARSRKREANKREEYNLKPIRNIRKRRKCRPN